MLSHNIRSNIKGSSLLLAGLADLLQQTGVLLADYLGDLGQALLGSADTAPHGLVLELDDLLDLLIALLVQVQVQYLDVLELRAVAEAQSALAVRIHEQTRAQLLLLLLNAVQTLYYYGRQLLQPDLQGLLLLHESKEVLITPASTNAYSNLATKKGSFSLSISILILEMLGLLSCMRVVLPWCRS